MKHFLIKQNRAGQFYWVYVAGNGEPIARCTEYHPKRETVLRSIEIMKECSDAATHNVHVLSPVTVQPTVRD